MKSNTYYFLLLFAISFIFRLIFILAFQFDGLYGQDAYVYYDYSKIFYTSVLNFQVPPNFYWSIGYRDTPGGQRDRISTLRFARQPHFRKADLKRIFEQADFSAALLQSE